MTIRYAVVEIVEDGAINAYGPFQTDRAAERYITALQSSDDRGPACCVVVLATPR